MHTAGLVALGILVGLLSGLTGIGGGAVLVPALIYLFGFSAHLAQGTTLALLVPPIGIVAAWNYYQRGYVDLTAAAIIALGFIAGSVLGSQVAVALPEIFLRRLFAVMLGVVAIEMFM